MIHKIEKKKPAAILQKIATQPYDDLTTAILAENIAVDHFYDFLSANHNAVKGQKIGDVLMQKFREEALLEPKTGEAERIKRSEFEATLLNRLDTYHNANITNNARAHDMAVKDLHAVLSPTFSKHHKNKRQNKAKKKSGKKEPISVIGLFAENIPVDHLVVISKPKIQIAELDNPGSTLHGMQKPLPPQ